jgi:hypothetical protein
MFHTNTCYTRREGMLDLKRIYAVRPYVRPVKFVCGHRGTIGKAYKTECFMCTVATNGNR